MSEKKTSQEQVPDSDQDGLPPFEDIQPLPEKDLFVWIAPNRPFKKRDKKFFSTMWLIVFLISLILSLSNQFLPIAVVLAVGFLANVLASVAPEEVKNRITSYGIHSDTHFCYWDEMGRYWFTKKYKHHLLNIETVRFPFSMILLLTEEEKEKIDDILKKYLLREQPIPTALDKAAKWLDDKIPLDRM